LHQIGHYCVVGPVTEVTIYMPSELVKIYMVDGQLDA